MQTHLPQMQRLLEIMAKLRDKQTGCPWDIEQNFATIAPYTIEEAYEVADAIERGDMASLKEELGDLLLQVVFHAQMAQEMGAFAFEDVAHAIGEKMFRRHPHVFGDEKIKTADAQTANWEKLKAEERAQKAEDPSLLADLPKALPALMRAEKMQKRAAKVGFDWPTAKPVIDKIREELAEVEEALEEKDQAHIAEEIGDLLFVCANLARHAKVDPEEALRQANSKFERRFRYIEDALRAAGKQLQDVSLEAMEALWQQAKKGEKK